jgi:2-polyprenyl-3-methyl-5-hydroxy-6-metoxy-1,4-benzoquinol methylase
MTFQPARYWDRRYATGGTSGAGSRGVEAHEKAAAVNHYIAALAAHTVLDLGCGDGVVAAHIMAPVYVGYDFSPTVVEQASRAWASPIRTFTCQRPTGTFDLVISLDVIFHLVHDHDYAAYMADLFSPDFGHRAVLVYSTNHDERGAPHVLHRRWLADVPAGWWPATWAPANTDKRKGIWLLRRSGR